MAPRSSWKGFLNLSLVSVPVKAYSAANSGSQIRLNQLCAECHSRIRQKTICPVHGELDRGQIVKGYEYAKDQYVVIDLDELDRLRAEDEGKAIRIDRFIAPDQLDPLYMSESSYYLLPDGAAGQKPFALLHRAMREKDLFCVAHIVLHNKEQLVVVRAVEDVLCMTVLRYAHQVKAPSSFSDELVSTTVSDAEFDLALTLIDETTSDEFDLSSFHDQYTERMTQLIEAKVTGQEIVEAPAAEAPSVINLMDALKASVARAQQTRQTEAAPRSGGTVDKVARTTKKAASSKPSKSAKKTESPLAKSLAGKTKKKAPRKKRTG